MTNVEELMDVPEDNADDVPEDNADDVPEDNADDVPEDNADDVPYLHTDSLHYVFQYLDYADLMSASITCKIWHDEAMFELKTETRLCKEITLDKPIEDVPKWIRFLKRNNLQSLDLSQSGEVVSDCIAEGIADSCPNLRKFVANGYTQLTDYCLKTILGGCKVLKHLIINGSAPDNDMLLNNHGFTRDRRHYRLNVNSPNCEKENVLENVFRLCPKLETLEMSGLAASTTPFGIQLMSGLTAAKTPFIVEKVLPSLKVLRVSRVNPGQEGPEDFFDSNFANVLEKTPNLEVLDVSGNFVGDELYDLLRMCPNLVELDVGACHIKYRDTIDDFLPRLHGLRLTKLSCNNFNYNNPPYPFPSGIGCLAGFPQLSELSVACLVELENKHAVELIKKLPQLKTLNMAACPGVGINLRELLQEENDLKKKEDVLSCDISWANEFGDVLLPDLNIRIFSKGW